MVKIDSGPLEATDKFEQVPKDKWRTLMRVKRDFLSTNLAYDCRCLVEFCQEAELVYSDCGFASAAEMIQHGYELDPVEIELAVAWLKHNQPKQEVSLEAVTKTADKIRELKDVHPQWTQQQIADEVGCSQQYVAKVITTKDCESQESVVIPSHLNGSHERTDFRKLPPELQEKVAAKEVSLNAAAIEAGIRKKPTPEEIVVKTFAKVENRLSVLEKLVANLTESEKRVLKDWMWAAK
jgi:hypothetical protein